jgi:hypothetical protein
MLLRNKADIEFLVERRYPFAKALRGRGYAVDKPKLLEIEAYRADLLAKPGAEFQALLDEERGKARVEWEAQREREARGVGRLQGSAQLRRASTKAVESGDYPAAD